jgi:hypothetical protein
LFLLQWGSQGSADGQFQSPFGVAIGPNGRVYVADRGNYRIQFFDPNGAYLGKWNCGACDIVDIAAEPSGDILVADQRNSAVHEYTADGAFVRDIGTVGMGPGQLELPTGIDVDASGNIHVVNNTTGFYYDRFSASGTIAASWVISTSFGVGAPGYSCAAAGNGDVFIAYLFMGGLRYPDESTISRSTADGTRISSFVPGIDVGGGFRMQVDPTGNLYVARFPSPPYIVLLDGHTGAVLSAWGVTGSGPGQFNQPFDLALDSAGNLYVVDLGNSRVEKFGTSPTPVHTRSWGAIKSAYR